MTNKPITTPEEMLEAAIEIVDSEGEAPAGYYRGLLRALRSRIAPPDPRHEGLRERIRAWLSRGREFYTTDPEWLNEAVELLDACLVAPEPTAETVRTGYNYAGRCEVCGSSAGTAHATDCPQPALEPAAPQPERCV